MIPDKFRGHKMNEKPQAKNRKFVSDVFTLGNDKHKMSLDQFKNDILVILSMLEDFDKLQKNNDQ